jgi:hypothetical protein
MRLCRVEALRAAVHKAVNWQTYCMAEQWVSLHDTIIKANSQCITSLSLADISIYSSTKITGITQVVYSLKLFPLFSLSFSFQALIFLNINVCLKVFHSTHNFLNFSRELLFVKQLNILLFIKSINDKSLEILKKS